MKVEVVGQNFCKKSKIFENIYQWLFAVFRTANGVIKLGPVLQGQFAISALARKLDLGFGPDSNIIYF